MYALARRGETNLSTGRLRQLTARERRYIRNRYGPPKLGPSAAYLEAIRKPDGSVSCSPETAKVSACRMEKRLKQNPALWHDILAAAEIDDFTLAGDLNRLRRAKKTELYQGKLVANEEGKPILFDDNGTQMRAVELITDILGHRKASLELTGKDGGPIELMAVPDMGLLNLEEAREFLRLYRKCRGVTEIATDDNSGTGDRGAGA